MRRRFNYTGRRKILQKDIGFSITTGSEDVQKFHADISLADYSFPKEAKVWVEAYDRNAIMRFPFGTVDSPIAETPTTLDAFIGTDAYYFRVKVVDPAHQNLLLAAADSISPVRQDEEDQARKSLLRVTTGPLDHLPWRLEFPAGDYPLLIINNDIDAGKSLARSNTFFQAIVFPMILNVILTRILIEDQYRPAEDPDDDDKWKEAWLIFAASLPGNSRFSPISYPSEEDVRRWIDDTVEAFCKRLNALRKVRVALKEIE